MLGPGYPAGHGANGSTRYVAAHEELVPAQFRPRCVKGYAARRQGDAAAVEEHAALVRRLHGQPVRAVLCIQVPDDWATNLQVCCDVLLSKAGVPGERGEEQVVDCYFSNPDIVYQDTWREPRITQGSFRVCLEALFHRLSGGRQLRVTTAGKPTVMTYDFAQNQLLGRAPATKRVYMVGDNPASDIKGAVAHNGRSEIEWHAILVRTGVWSEGADTAGADHIADDFTAAVAYIEKREASLAA